MQLLEVYERAVPFARTNRNRANALRGQHSCNCARRKSATCAEFSTRDKPLENVSLESV